ncbi:MAG: NAD-dependent epimerase/dehydratase family protein [Candidatus Omnitrophica bacterium]|nr:NAD-dependent epimerase/dehydratase family protein [Candidatus Omnitrophota bacterium]
MTIKHKRVFITGASGFIGSHIVDRLVEAGYELTALVREQSDLSFVPTDRLTLCQGDLTDYESVEKAMKNCEVVVHAAARTSDWGNKEKFYRANVEGTQNLLKAARENKIKKIILISTTAVLGEEDSPLPKKEDCPYKPVMPYFIGGYFGSGMNLYRHTKMLAEKKAIKFCSENGIGLIVLRPVWVYGPREFHAGPYEFCRAVLSGSRFLPMGRKNRFHVIYVKDVAISVELALKKDLAGVHIFNLGNEEAPCIRNYFSLFCEHLNVKSPFYVSFRLVYPAGILLELLARLFRAKKPYLLTSARVKMFYCNNIYDVSKARRVLGFRAEMPLDEGVRETIQWWKDNGYLADRKEKHRKLKQRYVVGAERLLLDIRIAVTVFLKYLLRLFKGEISLRQYLIFLKRLMLFSKVFSYNKAVRINGAYKIHLYLPAFPSRAFYRAIDKFLILDEKTIPTTVIFSMTRACTYNCAYCYQKRDGGDDLPEDKLIQTAKEIQNLGVSLFDIEGGEPLLRFERLFNLIQTIDDRSEVWINTTGHSLTYQKALRLKKAGLFGVMISIHRTEAGRHDELVGRKGAYQIACSAIKIFQRAGLNTVINCCPSLKMIKEGGIEKIMELGRGLNCSFVQIIHEKPSGGRLSLNNTFMDKKTLDALCDKHIGYNRKEGLKLYPSLSMQVFEASPIAFGCTAGGIERFYVNAHGEVQPCEFLNISFGNVQDEGFMEIYKRMRDNFKKPALEWLCNSRCSSIAKYVNGHNISFLPLKKEDTLKLIKTWPKRDEVPLYGKMKICERV